MKTGKVVNELINYYLNDIKRINHFLKVYGFAKAIAELEKVDERTLSIIEVAALTHDIGIKISEEKYNSSAGKYQEIEGPAIAKKLLSELGYDNELIERVCYLIGNHHTYNNIDGIDYQILVEADFLVNFFEDNMEKEAINNVKKNIFKTKSAIAFFNCIY